MFLKKILNKISFSWKIILTNTIIFCFFFMIILLFLFFQVKYVVKNSAEKEFKNTIQQIKYNFEDIKNDNFNFPNFIQIDIYDIRKTKIFSKNKFFNLSPPYYLDKIIYEEINDKTSNTKINILHYAELIEKEGKYFYIQISKNINYQSEFISKTIIFFITLLIITIIFSLLASTFSVKRNLKIITKIATEAKNINIDNLYMENSDYKKTNDEINFLYNSFNEMIYRLNISVSRQNEFISDASHELKTPLAIIKGYADMIRRWGYKDEKILKESLSSISSEVDNMSTLLENLLLLAKFDQSKLQADFKIQEIANDLIKIIENYKILEPQRNFNLSIIPKKLKYNRELINEVIRIIIDNAIKYNPDKKIPISILTNIDKKYYTIEISDGGKGLDESETKKIFERFYRVDKSRNKKLGGSGLGLSIAKEIINIHNGKIYAEQNIPKGLKLIIKLPL